MDLRRNNDGITLIELVISLAITAIVLTMLIVIINTAANSYKRTNEDVNLQLEAQMAINQLNTIIMEASNITKISEADPLKYRIECSTDDYVIYYKEDGEKLYLISQSQSEDYDTLDPSGDRDTEYLYLLAEYVKSFQLDMTGKTAKITMEFELGDQTFKTSKNVSLRNKK